MDSRLLPYLGQVNLPGHGSRKTWVLGPMWFQRLFYHLTKLNFIKRKLEFGHQVNGSCRLTKKMESKMTMVLVVHFEVISLNGSSKKIQMANGLFRYGKTKLSLNIFSLPGPFCSLEFFREFWKVFWTIQLKWILGQSRLVQRWIEYVHWIYKNWEKQAW